MKTGSAILDYWENALSAKIALGNSASGNDQPRLLHHRRVLQPPIAGRPGVRPLRLDKLWRHHLPGHKLRRALAGDVELQ